MTCCSKTWGADSCSVVGETRPSRRALGREPERSFGGRTRLAPGGEDVGHGALEQRAEARFDLGRRRLRGRIDRSRTISSIMLILDAGGSSR
jgi:hypothetical protein